VSVFAYVSGHGFGHWTRSQPVLAGCGLDVHVRTNMRALRLARRADWAASLSEVDVGPGVVQRGPLDVDVPATVTALEAHLERWPALLEAEVQAARAAGCRLVYADAPPVACAVAEALGVPALIVANFSWSWIYANLRDAPPVLADLARRCHDAEALATSALHLPGGGGLAHLAPGDARACALWRPATRTPEEARAWIPRPDGAGDRPLVIVSFGGYGDVLDVTEAAAQNPDYAFLGFGPASTPPPVNLRLLPHDHGLPHQDLVLGADCVLAKPGYGTVAECYARPTPMAYVEPSGAFPEHPRLVETIERSLPCARLSLDDFRAGRWGPALERARVAAAPPRTANAAAEAAAWVRAWHERGALPRSP